VGYVHSDANSNCYTTLREPYSNLICQSHPARCACRTKLDTARVANGTLSTLTDAHLVSTYSNTGVVVSAYPNASVVVPTLPDIRLVPAHTRLVSAHPDAGMVVSTFTYAHLVFAYPNTCVVVPTLADSYLVSTSGDPLATDTYSVAACGHT